MTWYVLHTLRLTAVVVAVAAGIAGFAPGDAAPAGATPPAPVDLVLVEAG